MEKAQVDGVAGWAWQRMALHGHGTGPQGEAEAWSLLTLATRASSRTRGLLFDGPHDDALLLMPCRDVHTVGMLHRIDVAFVGKTGLVLEAHRSVGPFRRLANRRAVAVVERFSRNDVPWFEQGDRVALGCLKEEVQ